MLLHEALQTYHDLLTDQLAQDSYHQLDDQLWKRALFFGDRPLCTVLRPRFFTPRQYRFLRTWVQKILQVFDKVYRAGIADPLFLDQFKLDDWEIELIQHDPGF